HSRTILMANNSTLPVSVGTEVFANEDIGPGVHYPRVKMVWGAAGVVNDASAANPVPVTATQSGTWNIGTITTLPAVVQGTGGASAWKVDGSAVTQPISGTVTANAGTGTFTTSGAITAIVPGTAATNLGKAIDSAVGSTATGIGALVKPVAPLATLAPAAADWTPLHVDSTAALWVRIIDSQ